MSDFPHDVALLAQRIANHSAVPFLGAGCSLPYLGVDWDALRVEMVGSERAKTMSHLAAASKYVEEHSREALVELLRSHLLVDAFDDAKDGVPLYLMGMGFPAFYTTNQDNVLEACYEYFGRGLEIIATVDNLATQDASKSTLYKFHGSLEYPESIVFAQEDYDHRMEDSHHPLDLRLTSDCLSKSIIFFGYSFRDPNVQLLFQHLSDVFGSKLPPAFLVQYSPNREFEQELEEKFGITAVDCSRSYPDADSDGEAFGRFLADLNACVASLRTSADIGNLFSSPGNSPTRVVSRYEVEGIGKAISQGGSIDDLVSKFRASYDNGFVPPSSRQAVVDQYVALCHRTSTPDEYSAVRAALFWLGLDVERMTEAVTACCAAANVLPAGLDYMSYHPPTLSRVRLPKPLFLAAVAYSFQLLRQWGRPISAGFYSAVSYWTGRFPDPSSLSPEFLEMINTSIGDAYSPGKTTYEHPVSYARRIAGRPRTPEFHEIRDSLEAMLPRRLLKPMQ